MNNPMLNKHLFKHQNLFSFVIEMTVLCLLVSWGVELLLRALFSI